MLINSSNLLIYIVDLLKLPTWGILICWICTFNQVFRSKYEYAIDVSDGESLHTDTPNSMGLNYFLNIYKCMFKNNNNNNTNTVKCTRSTRPTLPSS